MAVSVVKMFQGTARCQAYCYMVHILSPACFWHFYCHAQCKKGVCGYNYIYVNYVGPALESAGWYIRSVGAVIVRKGWGEGYLPIMQGKKKIRALSDGCTARIEPGMA